MPIPEKVEQPAREPRGRRILSLDGGGIYGLVEALWLKELCISDETFLDGTDIDLFAGCSSGAINALLLARYDRPRDAVLGGVLEAFWTDQGTFTNSDPMGAWLSLFGLTPWFSERDFLQQLERHFGNITLRELKKNVLISAYNWTGGTPTFTPASQQIPWPFSLFAPQPLSGGMPGGESWGPKYFVSYRLPEQLQSFIPNDPNLDYRVVDIAYGAATPPGFRKIRAGIGDGASFTANPAVAAIASIRWFELSDVLREAVERSPVELKSHGHADSSRQDDQALSAVFQLVRQYLETQGRDFLSRVSVLSVGSGQFMPAYWSRDIDLGFSTFQSLPTNPAMGVWYSPSAYSLDPATKGDEYTCWTLLGDRFYRLNPQVLSMPTVMAAFVARFPGWRDGLLNQIQTAVGSFGSRQALVGARQFLSKGWHGAAVPDDVRRSHPLHPQVLIQQFHNAIGAAQALAPVLAGGAKSGGTPKGGGSGRGSRG
jgi:hypothetical protein